MPRKPRIHVPGAFYHVTLRGNHRQNIFFSAADHALLEQIVCEVIERLRVRVHAYVWMSNHIHLLVQVSDVPLGRVMLCIAGRYARAVQRRFATTGHLFECRYHAVLVDADEYLLELIRYIHLNPVRARMVRAVDAYQWSSHHAYAGARVEPWVTTQFALSLFHTDPKRARTAYLRFVHARVSKSHASASPLLEVNEHDARILGGDEFTARALRTAWAPVCKRTLEEIVAEACAQFEFREQDLRSPGRDRKRAYARAWIAHQALKSRAASLSAVATLFGRDESTLRESVERYFPL